MTRTQSTLRTQRARLAIMRLIGVAALVACMTALLWWQAKQAQATFPGQISIEDTSVTEGDSGTSEATFAVTLTDPGGDTVTVNYETLDGTATQPDDYQQTGGTLTFGSNETTKTVTVPVNGDTSEEGDENFSVVLQSPQNADLADDVGLGTIVDDDVSTGNQAPLAADDAYSVNEEQT